MKGYEVRIPYMLKIKASAKKKLQQLAYQKGYKLSGIIKEAVKRMWDVDL